MQGIDLQAHSIPLNDLKRHSDAVAMELSKATGAVLSSGQFVLGQQVEAFEEAFARYCAIKHVVSVANGTDALELALRAAGIGPGDEVMTVANAGGYSTTAILHAGAVPVYADIDPSTLLISASTLLQAVTPATKAVIVTHLYGLMADMPSICAMAEKHNILIIEDCAQAHGAAIEGKKAGSWGKMGCFSFYPTKNLGGIGDSGCIITEDGELAGRLRSLRQYGWEKRKYYLPHVLGRNSRMDELQAAVLLNLLPYLDIWNNKRRNIVQRYREALASLGIGFQQVDNQESYCAHLSVVRLKDRERVRSALHAKKITTEIHYPVADYMQPAVIAAIGQNPPLPNTQQVISEILTLPCFPEMTDSEVEYVISAIREEIAANGSYEA